MKEKILWGIAVVGLVLGGWAWFSIPSVAKLPSGQSFGAAGNLLAEQYIPYVLYNGGYNSAKDIETSANFEVGGTSTLTGDVTLSGGDNALVVTTTNAATSTIDFGCLQTTATSTLTPIRFVISSAGTSTATYGAGSANGGVSWQYGTCPI